MYHGNSYTDKEMTNCYQQARQASAQWAITVKGHTGSAVDNWKGEACLQYIIHVYMAAVIGR